MYFVSRFICGFVGSATLVVSLFWVVGYTLPLPFSQHAASGDVPSLGITLPLDPASAVYVDPALLAATKREAARPRVTFALMGDVMLARGVHATQKESWPDVFSALKESDAKPFARLHGALANLEGVFMASPDRSDPRTFTFHFDTDAVQALTQAGITHVSLANNHSDNGGTEGTVYTHAVLDAAGVAWVGGHDPGSVVHVGTIRGNNLDMVIIGVNLTYTTHDITDIIREYAQKPRTRVLVYPHWGTEYASTANSKQRRLAREWVDAGADLVVGSHPHVVQDMEVYNGVPIVYSLGNAVFDQDWSQETSEGLILLGEFTDDELRMKGVPIEMVSSVPHFAREAAALRVYERIGYQLSSTQMTTFVPAGGILERR